MKYIKQYESFTGVITALVSAKIITEIFGVIVHKVRVSTNKNRSVEDIIGIIDGKFKLVVSDKKMEIKEDKRRHKTIVTIDLNNKSAIVDVNYSGIIHIKDSSKILLSNADIYNICNIVSKGSTKVDYDSINNSFKNG